jgi:glutaminase
MKNCQNIIERIYSDLKDIKDDGKVANYIPELGTISPNNFGAHITTAKKESFGIGDYDKKFSIQSISKILSLTLAYHLEGEDLWKRVDVEPSGNAFNSLQQLDDDCGIPRNPFINAGAIVICDVLVSHLENPKDDFLKFCREIANNQTLDYCKKVAASERETGYRNFALCNFIKSFGNIKNDVEDVLDFYFHICALEMSCKELSEIFLYLTEDVKITYKEKEILNKNEAKRINAIMLTCGFYDEAGEFAFRVGLPGKSGVGGGIIAVQPNEYCIAVWSPKLNKKGNSYKGMLFLEEFTTATTSSIF